MDGTCVAISRAMNLRRVLVGALSAIAWPAVVVCIPAGIVFFSTRVLAESAAPPREEPCDASTFTACRDAAALSYCSSAECTGPECACIEGQRCAGSTLPVQACLAATTCASRSALRAACDGIPTGSPCTPPGAAAPSRTCMLERCLLPDDGGFFESTAEVVCSGYASLPPSTPDSGTDASASPSSSEASEARDSGGCAASSGTAGGAALLLGLPLAMSTLLARRRRRR